MERGRRCTRTRSTFCSVRVLRDEGVVFLKLWIGRGGLMDELRKDKGGLNNVPGGRSRGFKCINVGQVLFSSK